MDRIDLLNKHSDAIVETRKYLKASDYNHFHPKGFLQAVYCKKCGTTIRGMVAVDDRDPHLMSLGVNANYVEINIECDDGSNHVTNCCSECAGSLSLEDLQHFLVADTQGLLKECVVHKHKMPDRLIEQLVNRKATGKR